MRPRFPRLFGALVCVALVPACGLQENREATHFLSSPVPQVTKLVPKPSPVAPTKAPVRPAPAAPLVNTYVAPQPAAAYVAPPPPAPEPLPPATPATIAVPATDPLKVYDSPSDSAHYESFSGSSGYGSQRVMLVTQHHRGWTEVLLPSKPNGRRGWVKVGDVGEKVTTWRIDVLLSQSRLVLRHGDSIVVDAPLGWGKPSTPTPTGTFYITDVTAPSDPSGPYGPRAYGTSAYSDALSSFDGKPPQIAIHGTNHPELIPGRISNGCLRLTNPTVQQMMPVLELGTPVYIRW